MGSPFPHHGPLDPSEVHGRDDLLATLTEKVTSRSPTVLIGPRRYGKTSALRRLANDLTEVNTIWLDLWGISSMSLLADQLRTALRRTTGRAGKAARLHAINLSISLTEGIKAGAILHPRDDPPDVAFKNLLQVLTDTATETPILLVVDEFQSIADIPDAAALLRNGLQHHYRDIGLVFSGSEPSTMRMLFEDKNQPFYGQADRILIDPLTLPTLAKIIDNGFEATGRDAHDTAERVHALTAGHPQRSMQIADAVWQRTPPSQPVSPAIWDKALHSVRQQIDTEATSWFAPQDLSARKVLQLVANGLPLFGGDAEALGLSHGSAAHQRDSLLADGTLARPPKQCRLVDPMFADWIRRTLPL